MARKLTRRTFTKMVALAAPTIISARALGAQAPSRRINLGFIGVGIHGLQYNLKMFLREADARALAVCDVFASRRQAAKEVIDKQYGNSDCRRYADFRDLLEDRDLDAVCISTPDHWHTPMTLRALSAGKHVMCEKPTLTIAEGRTLVQAVEKAKKVFAVGLEDRSVIQYHMLAQWVRNGAIGKLQRIEIGLPQAKPFPREEPAPVPAELNYEMWLGPAPHAPFTPLRTDAQAWRRIRDYSGGTFTDWGSHLLDTAQVAMSLENSGPVEASGKGIIPPDTMASVPIEFAVDYRYANDVPVHVDSSGVAIKFIGDKGWVGNKGWRGRLEASDEKILHIKYAPGESKLWERPPGEHRNFLDAIVSGKRPMYPVEDGHRLSTALHVGCIAMELGRPVKWDPAAEAFIGDDAANALRSRTSRSEWEKLPRPGKPE